MLSKLITKVTISLIVLVVFTVSLFAHDIVPGKKQTKAIALTGGTIYTVSGPVISNGTIVFDKGKIIAVGGSEVRIPPGAEVIDVSGKQVYPGLIITNSTLGLMEIEAARATRDASEVGDINPNARADVAYNPDSDVSPTIRSNGVTTAQIVPQGGLLSGTSAIINLDGWSIEDCGLVRKAGIHLNWPFMKVIKAWWMPTPEEEQKKNIPKNLKNLEKAFDEARQYWLAKKGNQTGDFKIDARWEAMIPVFEQEVPLFVQADEYKQIEAAVALAKKYNLKMILVGGGDCWMLADLLKENNIPVILRRVHSMADREEDDFDTFLKLPKVLLDAGVKFCLSNTGFFGHWDARNLPFLAGTSVAYGMERASALRSVTLWPAEIIGIADRMGSLEVGKDATIIVSTGDIMDVLTNEIVYEFIQGKKVDLDDKHKKLYRKYSEKYK